MSVLDLTLRQCEELIKKANKTKNIGEWKAVGREFRDKHKLTDREVIEILNGRLLK